MIPMQERNRLRLSVKDSTVKIHQEYAKKIGNVTGGENEIRLYGPIDEDAYRGWYLDDEAAVFPSDVENALKEMNGPVTVRVNSPGGDVFAGNAISGLLSRYNGEVTVRVEGLAASAASAIAMRGDIIEMDEGSQMMIHRAHTSLFGGEAPDFRKTADILEKTDEDLIYSYTKRNRRDLDEDTIRDMVHAETWMTASEAVEKGFADRESNMEPAVEEASQTVDACAKIHAEIQQRIVDRLNR